MLFPIILHFRLNKSLFTKNQIYTLQEKCQFINHNLVVIENKLNSIKKNNQQCCKTKNIQIKEAFTEFEKKNKQRHSINIPLSNESNDYCEYELKIKSNTISDEEMLLYGDYVLDQNIEKRIIHNFKQYLLSKLSFVSMTECNIIYRYRDFAFKIILSNIFFSVL